MIQCHASATSQHANTTEGSTDASKAHDIHLKVFNPANKKEFKMFTLRNLSMDETDSPEKLKKQIADQYGHELNPKLMEVGYFKQSKKLWLNNRLDMNDMWDLISKNENITLWCIEVPMPVTRKRSQLDTNAEDNHAETYQNIAMAVVNSLLELYLVKINGL